MEKKQISLYLPLELHAKLVQAAADNHRSLQKQIIHILEIFRKERKEEEK